ncbi:MAG: class I SAM-dependent methyltransferase [Rhizobiales bacterium]|nr:class I SAM-dependent methyltransferase [Hyphomicrobiales bacterium]
MPSALGRYQRIAPFYDLLDLPFEHGRYRHIRPRLFDGLSGRILDAGVGTGRNISFYPQHAEVIGIDISPAMLARAERRRISLGAIVELRQMDVTKLAFADRSLDAAVATFLFCVLPENLQQPALRELARVVRLCSLLTRRLIGLTYARGEERAVIYIMEARGLSLPEADRTLPSGARASVQYVRGHGVAVWSEHDLAFVLVSADRAFARLVENQT